MSFLRSDITEEQLLDYCENNAEGTLAGLPVPPIWRGVQAFRAWRAVRIASEARQAAKTVVFANRTASELEAIDGWGTDLEGVRSARSALDTTWISTIMFGVSILGIIPISDTSEECRIGLRFLLMVILPQSGLRECSLLVLFVTEKILRLSLRV